MNTLFFDTETTGKSTSSDLVQLAAVLVDGSGTERAAVEVIVKPDGFVIPIEATAVHGISQEMALDFGIRLKSAVSLFMSLSMQAHLLVAHNLDYDDGIMTTAFYKAGVTKFPWKSAEHFCTMKQSTRVCKIPSAHPKHGPYKWPTLSEAHKHFTGEAHEKAHSAMGDVRACIAVYRELCKCISQS